MKQNPIDVAFVAVHFGYLPKEALVYSKSYAVYNSTTGHDSEIDFVELPDVCIDEVEVPKDSDNDTPNFMNGYKVVHQGESQSLISPNFISLCKSGFILRYSG